MNTSTATSLLVDLCRQGLELRVTEDKQRIAAPAAALTPELRAALIAHKTELLGLLTRMEEYRSLLQKAFSRVASRKGPTEEESERFLDEQTRYLDELGPALLASVFEASASSWRAVMGTCPWCGGQGNCHQTTPARDA
jgi:TubC N-terminal docking domain